MAKTRRDRINDCKATLGSEARPAQMTWDLFQSQYDLSEIDESIFFLCVQNAYLQGRIDMQHKMDLNKHQQILNERIS